MNLRKGKISGTIVADYPYGEERQYMIEHYGGRLVASGMSNSDIDFILYGLESKEAGRWVIQYDNGTYNYADGYESTLRLCSKYDSRNEALKIAENLTDVKEVKEIE